MIAIHQPYIYKLEHIPSKRWYIGVRTAKKCHPNDGYLCSSKTVKRLYNENPSEWTREILFTGPAEEMLNLEVELLELFDAKNDTRSFNLHNGDGKFSMSGKIGGRAGKEPWNKGKKTNIEPWNKGLSAKDDERIAKSTNAATAACVGRSPWNKGLTKHDDIRIEDNTKKSGISKRGAAPWNKGLTKETSEIIKNGTEKSTNSRKELKLEPWNKGLKTGKQSPELVEKRVQGLRGKKRPQEVCDKIRATKALKKKV